MDKHCKIGVCNWQKWVFLLILKNYVLAIFIFNFFWDYSCRNVFFGFKFFYTIFMLEISGIFQLAISPHVFSSFCFLNNFLIICALPVIHKKRWSYFATFNFLVFETKFSLNFSIRNLIVKKWLQFKKNFFVWEKIVKLASENFNLFYFNTVQFFFFQYLTIKVIFWKNWCRKLKLRRKLPQNFRFLVFFNGEIRN